MEFDAFDAWLAGFIDGDGCICISHAREYPFVFVSISQHQRGRRALEEIERRYGGSISRSTSPGLTGPRDNMLCLAIRSQTQVHALLTAVLPHLRIKQEKAYQALEVVTEQLGDGRGARRFTMLEDAVIRRHYKTKTAAAIASMLGRSEAGIWGRAHSLGLTSIAEAWSASDDDELARLYPTTTAEKIGQQLDRSRDSVRSRIKRLQTAGRIARKRAAA